MSRSPLQEECRKNVAREAGSIFMKGQDTDRIIPVKNPAAQGLGWLGFGILVLAGLAARGLRFGGRFGLWAHWDEVRLAVPALGILQGDFPIHHLGVEYMGAFPSYLLAPWFLLFGSSPPALDCLAYGTGLALWGTGYLVARGFAGRRAAAGYALVSVVPTLLLKSMEFEREPELSFPAAAREPAAAPDPPPFFHPQPCRAMVPGNRVPRRFGLVEQPAGPGLSAADRLADPAHRPVVEEALLAPALGLSVRKPARVAL